MGISGPCGLAGAELDAFAGGFEAGEDGAAAGVPPAGAWPQASIAGEALAEKTTAGTGISINKIGRSCFIQIEGVGTCKENCSVSRGIPACSREYRQWCSFRRGISPPATITHRLAPLLCHPRSAQDDKLYLGSHTTTRISSVLGCTNRLTGEAREAFLSRSSLLRSMIALSPRAYPTAVLYPART